MNRIWFRRAAALLLCSGLTPNVVGCGGSGTPTTQAAKPIASAGQSKNVTVGQKVTLDGSASKGASPGDKLTYDWALTSIPTGSKAALAGADVVNPTFTPDLPGAYDVMLIVNSGGASSDPSKIRLTAAKENAKPIAVASASPSTVMVGNVVTLDGSKSSDTDGDKLTYKWTVASSPPTTAVKLSPSGQVAKPTFQPELPGQYKFTLVVNDGQIDSDPADITVQAGGLIGPQPTASIGAVPGAKVNVPVVLDGSGSKPWKAGDTLDYAWTITAGQTTATLTGADKSQASFTATMAGTYKVQLVVTEGTAQSAPQVITFGVLN